MVELEVAAAGVAGHDAGERVEDEGGREDLAALLVDLPVDGPRHGEEHDADGEGDDLPRKF